MDEQCELCFAFIRLQLTKTPVLLKSDMIFFSSSDFFFLTHHRLLSEGT